jgi:hypothetical protein
MVKVGNTGDVGSVEIVEMLFTVKGPTAGAILMEWNIKADAQGSGMSPPPPPPPPPPPTPDTSYGT